MSETQVSMYGWGIGVTYKDGADPAHTGLHDTLTREKGFIGYDEQDGVWYYFFISQEYRDDMKALLTFAGFLGEIEAYFRMQEPVLFHFN